MINDYFFFTDFFFGCFLCSSSCNAKEALGGLPFLLITSFSVDFACLLIVSWAYFSCSPFLGRPLGFFCATGFSTLCSSCSSISFRRILILMFCFLFLTVISYFGINLKPDSQTSSFIQAATKCLQLWGYNLKFL